jgi:protein-tyrosine phosphatase
MTAEAEGRPWKLAFFWMAACSLLFVVVYGGCNWITSRRSDVGSWFFDWERHIPFVPLTIIPYWSIDFVFVGSFFICRDRSEIHVLARRIALAILVAGTCFLLFPLRIGFPRPQVNGVLGTMFNALRGFDQPYNLAPSLHIALRTILWPVYVPRTKGLANLGMRVWFLMIGVSSLLTYQHQAIDVATGWVLAVLCLYLVPDAMAPIPPKPELKNLRVGSYYFLGFIATLVLAIGLWPWGSLLLWPAAALALVAAAYFEFGARVFRKSGGRLPFSTRLLLLPYLVGQHLSLLHYRRRCRARDQVVPGVWIGCKLHNRESAEARRQGVTAVLDLGAEFSEASPFLDATYLNLPILDLTAPTTNQLHEAVAFIQEQAAKGTVYVHCKLGYSRTAAVVGAYLMASGRANTAEEVVDMLRKARPTMVVRPEAWQALRGFSGARHSSLT